MIPVPVLLAAAVAAMVAILVTAEHQRERIVVWVSRLVASALFIALALAQGATASPYGLAILAGLCLSFVGDLLLLVRGDRPAFMVGIFAFLAAHAAYLWAFWPLHGDAHILAVLLLAFVLPGVLVGHWLWPHVHRSLRGPVVAYTVVISAMFAVALSVGQGGTTWLIPVGAGLFYASDLAVARQRFIRKSFSNKAWGLPLYYAGQVLLAWSVGVVG